MSNLVSKSKLNAIHNAGTFIQNFDYASELSDNEIDDHHIIGELLIKFDRDVLKLLLEKLNGSKNTEAPTDG